MTTIHAQIVGDQAVLPILELERLVAVARKSEQVDLQLREGETSTRDMMSLAVRGGAFDFWLEEGEDIYSRNDGEPVDG